MQASSQRRQIPLADARKYVEKWQASGLSQKAFSLQHGFSGSSIWRWIQRINRHDAKQSGATRKHQSVLTPVVIESSSERDAKQSCRQQLEIILSDQIKMRLPAIINVKQIAALIEELQPCS